LLRQLVETVAEVIEHGQVRQAAVTVSPDLDRIGALALAERAVQVEHVESGDVELVRIAALDQPGLFARITAVLALHGCDVVGAAAVTRADGVAIDEFRIARVAGVEPTWEKVQHDLRTVLSGDADADARLEQRLKSLTRRKRAVSAVPARLEVLVSNDASDSTTVVEVRAPDAPVVLYRVANALSHAGVNIRSAVVATLGHEVVDVFYVTVPGAASGRLAEGDFEGLRDAIRLALA
jgi:[protein-PII] uridylyltransferase